MTSPWPQAESSSAMPCGNCPKCGGIVYALLTHHCSTSVRLTQPLPIQAPMPAKPKNGALTSDE